MNHIHRAYVCEGVTGNNYVQISDHLRSLVDFVIRCLAINSLFNVSVDCLTDILVDFSAFFDAQHLHHLAEFSNTPWAEGCIAALHSGDFDEDSRDYSRLLFAYGDAVSKTLRKTTRHRPLKTVLQPQSKDKSLHC